MRLAIGIEYNGTHYHGWQAQDNLPTVQQSLELAIARVANHPIELTCAGRTDAGVHAKEQIAHFDTHVVRDHYRWLMGVNTYLPPDIRVLWVESVVDSFHARYSAKARRYQYIIYNDQTAPAIMRHCISWYRFKLDEERMNRGGQYLIGEHDFSAFRGISCQAKTTTRNLHSLNIVRKDHYIILDIQANAFLHHMVRNIVGVLFEVGTGKREPEWVKTVLETKKRSLGGITAPPQGLYLAEVIYSKTELQKVERNRRDLFLL